MSYLKKKDLSMSHVDRMKTEHAELTDRLRKLNAFMDTPKFVSLEPVAQGLLAEQKAAMMHYHYVLGRRLEMAGEAAVVWVEDRPTAPIISEHLGEPVEVGGHDIDRDGPPEFS